MSVNHSEHLQELWNSWIDNKNEKIGNELIHHYMYLVHYHVEKIAATIPVSFDKNDLTSLGLMGLFDALNKFDPNRNLKFDTYATIRVHGAIMDGLRKEDWLPRTLRDKAKKIEQVHLKLEQRLGRTPSVHEISKELNISRKEVESTMTDTIYANMLSIETKIQSGATDEVVEIQSTIRDQNGVAPEEHVLESELKAELQQSIKQLNENEQIVISLFYIEELTLTEIGTVLNLTTSRISQIHKKAISKLKNRLSKLKVTVEV